jgi:60 kDa SS-A/Ro ribonucleoprotein
MATAYINHFMQQGNKTAPNSGKFQISDKKRLERFLILGTEGGTYYASERKLTIANAQVVQRLVVNKDKGLDAVATIVAVSDAGRAPKNDSALLALAIAVKFGTPEVRAAALAALPKVARIGTHLFHFLDYCKALQVGWGRSFRRAIGQWYLGKDTVHLAQQLVKYQSRDGWSNRDALRLSHAAPVSKEQEALFHWAVKGEGTGDTWPHGSPVELVWAFEKAKTITSVGEMVKLITDYKLPREAIPTQFLNSPEIWATMLPHMKPEATLRNLAKMTAVGLIKPFAPETKMVCDRLTSLEDLKKARLHPLKMFVALLTYKTGHGLKGSLSWTPDQNVLRALNDGFYVAFGAVEPTNKNIMKCLDVSGSMGMGNVGGVPSLTARTASGLLSMVSARVEKNTWFMGFSHNFIPLQIGPHMTLEQIDQSISNIPFGATDCSLPFVFAQQHRLPVDVFEVYTDSDTNSHRVAPARALQQYRDAMGRDAKLVVVGMTASGFSIADPNDAGMLDVVGFDTATPDIISDFIRE